MGYVQSVAGIPATHTLIILVSTPQVHLESYESHCVVAVRLRAISAGNFLPSANLHYGTIGPATIATKAVLVHEHTDIVLDSIPVVVS